MSNAHPTFLIRFSEEQTATAIRMDPDADPQIVVDAFGLVTPRPTIFITGGASNMSPESIQLARDIMNTGVAYFADKHNITVIDGGTEAGVMQMIGDARRSNHYTFPLIGIAPYHKVTYPGAEEKTSEAQLEDGHSHFVLVNSREWGSESQMIVNLTRAVAENSSPTMGILINGGQIAERDVYLAVTTADKPIPILILDGSGRTADNISTAFKTQHADSALIRAIIKGGDIRLTPIEEGVPSLLRQLEKHFQL